MSITYAMQLPTQRTASQSRYASAALFGAEVSAPGRPRTGPDAAAAGDEHFRPFDSVGSREHIIVFSYICTLSAGVLKW